MRKLFSSIVIGIIALAPAVAAEPDDIDKAYLMSLFQEPGKIQDELGRLGALNPPLAAYFVGISVSKRCGTPSPSDAIYKAGGGDEALKTREGRWTFIVGIAAGTMKFPSSADELAFCKSAAQLVSTAEKTVVKE